MLFVAIHKAYDLKMSYQVYSSLSGMKGCLTFSCCQYIESYSGFKWL